MEATYITVTAGMSGYYAVRADHEGIVDTGIGRYANFMEAENEAKDWARSEHIRYIPPQ
jgi:hypothetical protein